MIEIAKMLVLSTGHIDEITASRMTDEPYTFEHVNVYGKGEYGWFVNVREEIADREAQPKSLADCLDFAARQGCQWIMFDRDGDQVDELPTYEW